MRQALDIRERRKGGDQTPLSNHENQNAWEHNWQS